MSHTQKEKQKLLNRMRRIRGQVDAIQRVLEEDGTCLAILQQATACRGALDGFIAEVVEDHIREHVIDPDRRGSPQSEAAEELIEIMHSYLT
jgi:DNA-binding FrmR family transcriptional regulator